MTDTNPGGWPDPQRPGYPMNPERDVTDHWLDINGDLIPARWETGKWAWGPLVFAPEVAASDPTFRYLGPCHTPAEVAALIEAAFAAGAKAMREAAAQDADCECGIRRDAVLARQESGDIRRKARNNLCSDVCLALNAAAIRALPLPKMEDKTND
jgi:hypothetical protein